MAKPTIKKAKGPSVHSRAARRATSPSIDTDKSLKTVQPPPTTTHRASVLGIHQSAGVSKKTKRGRKSVLSTRAKARHEKGLERAEAFVDRTAIKVKKSKHAANLVETRKKSWAEINTAAGKLSKQKTNMFAGLAEEDDGDEWEEVAEVAELDDEMADVAPTKAVETSEAPAAALAAAQPLDDDEEIL